VGEIRHELERASEAQSSRVPKLPRLWIRAYLLALVHSMWSHDIGGQIKGAKCLKNVLKKEKGARKEDHGFVWYMDLH
jgi:hypothetical protein